MPPELAGANAHVAKRGADALGWSGDFVRRNVARLRRLRRVRVRLPGEREAARRRVVHPAGPRRRRHHLHGRDARRRRARRRGRHDAAAAALTRRRADKVVVAAGAIHTPALLARNGLGGPQLGRNLSLHPATAVWALMDEPVDMARGVPQSYFVDEFADEGIMLEGIAGPPDYVAMGLPVAGERHRELMAGYRDDGAVRADDQRRLARARALARPGGRSSATTCRTPTPPACGRGLERLAELFWAAGAQRVLLPLARKPELATRRGDPRAPPRDLKLMAFHPLGTARMDARGPRHGVLDADGRVHGTEGVYVCDGSAVPSSLGVNPQITIMTLATTIGPYHLCRS